MIFKGAKPPITQVLKGLFLRLGGRQGQHPIQLPWGADRLRFDDIADFSFALGARTGVLPTRLQDLMLRSASELEAELQGIQNLDERIASIVEANESMRLPCGPAIAHLGVSVFSKDYEWRTLFAQLVELPVGSDGFLRAALLKYQQYLRARSSTVRLVMEMKSRLAGVDGAAGELENEFIKATMMFTSDGELRPFSRDELRRLPQGEAVTLRLARGSAISLKLARHQFSLTHNREWTLVADNGKTYTLHAGVNCVGRGRDNDVSLDPDFRNVSRKHLLAQPLGNDAIVLTDISSHGTYVPPTALAS